MLCPAPQQIANTVVTSFDKHLDGVALYTCIDFHITADANGEFSHTCHVDPNTLVSQWVGSGSCTGDVILLLMESELAQ